MEEVIIDGVRYIPANHALANNLAIKRGLLEQFWGVCDPSEIDEKWEGLRVIVTDENRDNEGRDIADILAAIAGYTDEL